jgi:hypothetical protein
MSHFNKPALWWREPLWRFLLLGCVILAMDRLLMRGNDTTGAASAHIVVTASQQTALAEGFRAEQGREPTTEELQARLDRWIDEQVLYREALALGLDRRDAIVQRQLTQKMRFLIEDATLLPEPTQADLQAWLDQHPERYGEGPAVSFEQVFLSRGRHGDRLPAEAAAVARQLQQDPQAFVGLGDPFLVGQAVIAADAARLRRDFGAEFGAALAKLPQGQWAGPIASGFGLHLVRVTARAPLVPARLEAVRDRVRLDYQLAQREARNKDALAQLRARYRIEFEASAG